MGGGGSYREEKEEQDSRVPLRGLFLVSIFLRPLSTWETKNSPPSHRRDGVMDVAGEKNQVLYCIVVDAQLSVRKMGGDGSHNHVPTCIKRDKSPSSLRSSRQPPWLHFISLYGLYGTYESC